MEALSEGKKRRQLTREQREHVLSLRQAGLRYEDISQFLSCTVRQVQLAVTTTCTSPRKQSGRPSSLKSWQIDEIEAFILTSKLGELMSYSKLATGPFAHFGVSEATIRRAMRKRGHQRRPSLASSVEPEGNREGGYDEPVPVDVSWQIEDGWPIMQTDDACAADLSRSSTSKTEQDGNREEGRDEPVPGDLSAQLENWWPSLQIDAGSPMNLSRSFISDLAFSDSERGKMNELCNGEQPYGVYLHSFGDYGSAPHLHGESY